MGHKVLRTQRHHPESRDKVDTNRKEIGKVRGVLGEIENLSARGYRPMEVTPRRRQTIEKRDQGSKKAAIRTTRCQTDRKEIGKVRGMPREREDRSAKGYRPAEVTLQRR